MPTTQDMIGDLKRNVSIVNRQVNGLTHADSVLQLPFRGNCLNWVVGHMIVHRDKMLTRIGAEPLWDADDATRYDHGSEPITDGETAIYFDQMMADLQISQERLEKALQSTTDVQLDTDMQDRDGTIRDWLAFLVWHDTYHTGQTEYLRQLAGTNDKVI